jgi:pimeloyl-ACP methyl ester carboxylesterase
MDFKRALTRMPTTTTTNGETAILLHGIGATPRSMAALEDALTGEGYHVRNTAYPSTKHRLDVLADIVVEMIGDDLHYAKGPVHFVGHSMGGLVTRAIIRRHRPAKLGKVVMLGTPNHGSEVADLLRNIPAFKRIYGPAGQQLLTSTLADMGTEEPAVDFELGIIAGTRTIDPIGSYVIGKPSDGRVSVESTRLIGMSAHLILPVTHTFMPRNRRVIREVGTFLKTGAFETVAAAI